MPKFCVGPHVAPRKVYGQSDFKYVILKKFYLKLFNFVKILKMREKILRNPQFKKHIYTVQREDAH